MYAIVGSTRFTFATSVANAAVSSMSPTTRTGVPRRAAMASANRSDVIPGSGSSLAA